MKYGVSLCWIFLGCIPKLLEIDRQAVFASAIDAPSVD